MEACGCGLIGLMAVCAALSAQPQQQARDCYIKSMIGDVRVRKGDEQSWKLARPRMALKEKDAIRTFVESEVEIETSEGSVIRMAENSTVEMAVFSAQSNGATRTRANILTGGIIADVKKLMGSGSRFEFETPTAVASIRGTKVGFDVTSDQTRIRVYEGVVNVTPKGSRTGTDVQANQMTTVAKGQRTVHVERLAEKPEPSKPALKADSAARQPATADTAGRTRADTAALPGATSASSSTDPSASAVIDTAKAASPKVALSLAVSSPQDGAAYKPGETVTVTGRAAPSTAKVLVNGAETRVSSAGDFRAILAAPQAIGEFEITVDATHEGQGASVRRRGVVIQPAAASELVLTVSSPVEGQKFAKPYIPVSGVTTPGAEVQVSGMKMAVMPTGGFSGQVPIPDEETSFDLQVDATYEGKTKSVVRTVHYTPELRISIASPAQQQVVTATTIPVRGDVTPRGAAVSVNGTKMPVSATGQFSGTVTIPDEEGPVDLDFEAVLNDASKTESRTVVYKRPLDTYGPAIQPSSLPAISKTKSLTFTVIDRTANDEITFFREVGGARDSETGVAGGRFTLNLEDGWNDYAVWAEDKAGNRSQRVAARVAYLASMVWSIRMTKPASASEIIRLPPSVPKEEFEPRYTVRFSVINVPNDDPKLLKEVTVTNVTSGQTQVERTIADLNFDFDFDLDRRKPNVFTVTVRDINDIDKTATFVIEIR